MQVIRILGFFLLVGMIFSCKHRKEPPGSIGSAERKSYDPVYYVRISSPDEYKHYVSPAQGGILKKLEVNNKDTVRAGQIIAYFFSPDYMDIQKEYLAVKNEIEYLREELKRQGELTVENVASIKKLQKAQSEYNIKAAVCKTLEKKLRIIGFNPEEIFKNGPARYAYLLSPTNGIINYSNISPGQYVEPDAKFIYIQIKDTLQAEIMINHEQSILMNKNTVLEIYKDQETICEAYIISNIGEIKNGHYVMIASLSNHPPFFSDGLILKARLKK